MTPTKAALEIVVAVADAIRELGSVPSGHLYARLMGNLSLDNYNAIVKLLENAGAIKVENDLITWTGPR